MGFIEIKFPTEACRNAEVRFLTPLKSMMTGLFSWTIDLAESYTVIPKECKMAFGVPIASKTLIEGLFCCTGIEFK